MFRGQLIEHAKFIQAIPPIDTTGAGQDGVWVSMKHFKNLAVVLQTGAWAGGTSAVTLEQASDAAGTGAKAISFTSYLKAYDTDDTPDDAGAVTAVTSNTYTVGDNANVQVIEVRAEDLDINNGFAFVRVRTATPGSNADLIAGLYLLYNGDFAGKPTTLPSVLS